MKIARLFGGGAALLALAAVAIVYTRVPVRGFEIQTSAAVVNRPGADITDVYLFPSPANPSNVVAVMDVHPLIAAGAGSTTFFDQHVLYTMRFDNKYANEAVGSRPVEGLVIQFSVGAPSGGSQQVFEYGPGTPNQTGTSTTLLNGGSFSASGFIGKSFAGFNGTTIFAGPRENPFFMDLNQFYNIFPDRNKGSTAASCLPGFGNGSCTQGFNNPGTDFFSPTGGAPNILSIVVEMPRSVLEPAGTGPLVAYWATTSTQSGN